MHVDPTSEKMTRGAIKGAVERELNRSSYCIVDTNNFVKGFRYELHCIARSARTTHCMVHADTPVDICRRLVYYFCVYSFFLLFHLFIKISFVISSLYRWNGERKENRYSSEVFEDLARRFETPNAKQRWDKPLFTVRPNERDGKKGRFFTKIDLQDAYLTIPIHPEHRKHLQFV